MRRALFAFSFVALAFIASQMTCAEAESGGDYPPYGNKSDGGTDKPDGDDLWQCFTGTATNEAELLDHCTEAERVDRASSIPATTWDGTSPLP